MAAYRTLEHFKVSKLHSAIVVGNHYHDRFNLIFLPCHYNN